MDLTNTTQGTRVVSLLTGKTGSVTRVIDRTGAIGGIVEVRWDGERLRRTAGFEAGRDLREVVADLPVRHSTGLVWIG